MLGKTRDVTGRDSVFPFTGMVARACSEVSKGSAHDGPHRDANVQGELGRWVRRLGTQAARLAVQVCRQQFE